MKWFCTLVLLLSSGPALAQDVDALTQMSMEELLEIKIEDVYGASKKTEKVTKAPASITVIDRATIQRFGYTSLAEIVAGVRGFYIRNDRYSDYVGVRGQSRDGDYNARILVLVNGHRINDSTYQEGINFPVVDVDLIDKIEIIRGPSSSLYGSGAFFGVINIMTRKASQFKTVEVAGHLNTQERKAGRLTFAKDFSEDLSFILSGSYSDTKGNDRLYYQEYDRPEYNGGVYEDHDGEYYASAFTQFKWKFLTLEGAFSDRRKQIPTASYDTIFNDSRSEYRDKRNYVKAQADFKISESWQVKAVLSGDEGSFSSLDTDPYYDTSDSSLVFTESTHTIYYSAELEAAHTMASGGSLIFGAENSNTEKMDQTGYYHDPNYYLSYQSDKTPDFRSAFVQLEHPINEKIDASAGVRYDDYEISGAAWSPRLALIYAHQPTNVFKFIYGTAFRAPNGFEAYYEEVDYQKVNPDLKAETIENFEVIWEMYYNEHWRSTLNLFYYEVDDLITTATDPVDGLLYYDNLDQAKGYGGEAEVEAVMSNGMRGILSYTYSEVVDRSTKNRLPFSPHHLAKAKLYIPILSKLDGGVEIHYVGSQINAQKDLDLDPPQYSAETPGYFVVNLTLLSRELLPGLNLSGSVYNLLDTDYSHPAASQHDMNGLYLDSIPQDGITGRFKLTYSF